MNAANKPDPIIGHQGTSLLQWQHSRHLAALDSVDVLSLVPPGARAVVVAPHPDDEVLGCGGMLQLLAAAGRQLQLISVTDGSASHPGSERWPVERLSVVRPQESAEALRRLGVPLHRMKWLRGGFTDSQVAADESSLVAFIERHLRPGDVVFSTWCEDGHCDHEAAGRASIEAARRVGATCHELPVWTWHWASPKTPRCRGSARARFCCPPSKWRANATRCMRSPVSWKATRKPGCNRCWRRTCWIVCCNRLKWCSYERR